MEYNFGPDRNPIERSHDLTLPELVSGDITVLMPASHWARAFTVTKSDVDFIAGLLLEREVPLSTQALARALVEERLSREADAIRERYKDSLPYNPSATYTVGQRLVFPALDFASGTVVQVRPGVNPDYEPFEVISVRFDDASRNPPGRLREFAASLSAPHRLSEANGTDLAAHFQADQLTADEIMQAAGDDIVYTLEQTLADTDSLVQVAGLWFPRDLLVEVNLGHLHLTEAILDINGGGPLSTADILREIGGLGSGSPLLQEFSLNHAMRSDDRFDEVGPTGVVLWHLRRAEPEEVLNTPARLRYTPIDYDRALLTPELLELEAEINDELSPAGSTAAPTPADEAVIALIYPHRRAGTLPLTAAARQVFPSARQTPRVYVRLVDGQDGEAYAGWVVRKDRYVFGLSRFYRKHRLPVGAYVIVRRGEAPDEVVVDFKAHRPRTEWIRLVTAQGNQIGFENAKRSIGAEYDDLMILGADDLEAVDELFAQTQQQKRTLPAIMRAVIPGLGRLTPQGTVHAKTIYSAVNVVRRCPPGPIFAILVANPDFQNVGGHYWKLSDG